jgi:hypothetical protein
MSSFACGSLRRGNGHPVRGGQLTLLWGEASPVPVGCGPMRVRLAEPVPLPGPVEGARCQCPRVWLR